MLWWLCGLTLLVCIVLHFIFKSRKNNNKYNTPLPPNSIPFSPIELFYMRDYTFTHGQYNIVIPVEISFLKQYNHNVFVNNLRHVLNAVQRKHPLLQASVVCENNTMDIVNDRWYFSLEDNNEIPLKVIDTDDYEQVARQEMHTNFPLKGPMFRSTLCKGEKYHLLLTGFHLILDGASFLNLVKEIIQLLDKMDHTNADSQKNRDQIASMEQIETRPVPKAFIDQIDPKYHAGTFGNWIFLIKFFILQIRYLGFKGITFPLATDDVNNNNNNNKEQKSDFVTFELDQETTSRIIKKTKENKVSVSSLLAAATASVASKYVQFGSPNQKYIPVPLPVDLRRHSPIESTIEDLRAYSTGVYTFLKLTDNVWEMAQSCQQQIAQMLKSAFAVYNFQLYEILPKVVKGGNDQRCLVVSSFAPIQNMDSRDQFHSKIRGIVMSQHNTTNMVFVYLLTVEDKFIFNIWFNSSLQTEPVLQYAKSLEQFMCQLSSL